MDRLTEISKYCALLRFGQFGDDDLHRELGYQLDVLVRLGVSNAEINELIHDRHARENISRHRAELAVASVRAAANIAPKQAGVISRSVQQQSLSQRTEEYMRLTGRGTLRRGPPVGSVSVAQAATGATDRADWVSAGASPTPPPKAAGVPSSSCISALQTTRADTVKILTVPYGTAASGVLVHARDAEKGASYFCPGCTAALVLHAGTQRTKYFVHKADTACNGETMAHNTAKLLLAQIIDNNAASTHRIRLLCTCSQCATDFDKLLAPNAFTEARVEASIGQYRCDVLALRDDKPVLVVEVRKTHAVAVEKAEALALPWIELAADQVLDDPYYWRTVNGKLKATVCELCRAQSARIKQVAMRWNLPLGNLKYIAAVAPCWSCKAEIIWYWWQGVPFANEEPPQPSPSIVQFRRSKMYGGFYWMNVCPGCRAAQGDNFVFLASDSPFSHLPMRQTDEMKQQEAQNKTGIVDLFRAIVEKNL